MIHITSSFRIIALIWFVLLYTQINLRYYDKGLVSFMITDMAINVLDTRWLLLYMPVYLFGIWDSYRTTIDMNKVFILAEREEHRFNSFSLGAVEINYLDKRNPVLALMWSLFLPGIGQLYIHRIIPAFFVIIWTVISFYYSHAPEATTLLVLGKIQQATSVLNPEWLLYLPSLYGFSMYDSYMNTVENNKLFEKEQRRFLKDNYQKPGFDLIK
ncbi:hypothetical protein LG329_15760 [Virgibacillus necropolis]